MLRERNTPDTAIDDEHEALRLLADRSSRHGAYLCLNYRRAAAGGGSVRLRDLYKGARIVVQHLGGYGGMEVRSEHITYVTERVVTLLAERGWTRGTPSWGYTDDYERHLTSYGEDAYAHIGRSVGEGLDALLRLYGGSERTGT